MSASEAGKDKTEPRDTSIQSDTPLLENAQVHIDASPIEATSKSDKATLSVAIQQNYQGQNKVVAKGSGELAEQILQIAFDHGVKVRTDSDLVEILSTVDVESEIPLEALTAVATILNYVYDEQKQSNDEPV
ncbi:EscU/YscU/HrcU family type III secretion system export apparatus switch protein [Kiloniella sp.]|uniref:EscU/YscU/HrcU family type III secretion system export apparatus switch protein n=1 Tax=Kiloniella sp. TaxID=1938587 RepID=UPI003B02B673